MLSGYFTFASRNLLRQRGYALINILGLSIGMACAILIYLYVDFERSWDTFRPNAHRIYRVLREGPASTSLGQMRKPFEGLSGAVGPALVETFPEVEEMSRVRIGARWIRFGEHSRRTDFWFADTNFFDFFGMKLARGNQQTALTEPNNVVLNPDIAREFFGDEDPLGKVMHGQDGDYTVTGILEPLPENSMIRFNFITGSIPTNIRNRASWDDFRQSRRRRQTVTFIRLREGTDASALETKLPRFAATILPDADQAGERFRLQGFLRMRLHVKEDFPNSIDGLASGISQGNPEYLRTLILIAAAVLAVGCLNFMNLATARSIGRAREVRGSEIHRRAPHRADRSVPYRVSADRRHSPPARHRTELSGTASVAKLPQLSRCPRPLPTSSASSASRSLSAFSPVSILHCICPRSTPHVLSVVPLPWQGVVRGIVPIEPRRN